LSVPQQSGVQDQKNKQADPGDDLDGTTAKPLFDSIADDPQQVDHVAGDSGVSKP